MIHPNFTLEEMRCKDGTPVPKQYQKNAHEVLTNLQILRDQLGEPIFINSGYRTPDYNKRIGGAKFSQHTVGKACDITVKSKTPKQVKTIIERLIKAGLMKNGGIGLYPGFVHYDVRDYAARW